MSLMQNYWNSLNIDPKRPYHYLIGVCVHSATSGKKAGNFYLKYGPIKFTNKDISNVRDAVRMITDKWIKVEESQALENFNCKSLVYSISAMMFALRANMGTLHHFSSHEELDDKSFELLVKYSNTVDHTRNLLIKSKVRNQL